MIDIAPACLKDGYCFLARLSDDARDMTLVNDSALCHWRDGIRDVARDIDLQAAGADVWMAPMLERLARRLRALSDEMVAEMREQE